MKKYRYSEIFGRTVQGEGHHTGKTTSWIRFWGCTLNCEGFGQQHPEDPSTYDRPYDLIDLTDITSINDLPIFQVGCDSQYSWTSKYRHLVPTKTAAEIVEEVRNVTRSKWNPNGDFHHPVSGQDIHMCFTGGEPIMSQNGMAEVLQVMKDQSNLPNYVTIETNGTVPLKPSLTNVIGKNYAPSTNAPEGTQWPDREWFWSISPKLLHTSGELPEKAIHPDIVKAYQDISPHGQLKFVVNGTDESWADLEQALKQYRDVGVNFPVWVMAVGARKEEQQLIQATVCEQAFDRGYNFSARVHCVIFDNVVGK